MKTITAILILTFLTACGQTQPNKSLTQKKISRNFNHDVNMLIPDGDFTVDIMDQVTMSPRRQELMEKFTQAMKANPEWFLQQQKIAEQTGKEISYDTRLGLTEQEWKECKILMESMSDMQAGSSGVEKIQVMRDKDIVSFKSSGKLASLDSTIIDIKNKVVKVGRYVLPLLDTVCVTSSDNIFKTAWRGYKFQFSNLKKTNLPSTSEEMANFSMTLYGLTFGLFEKTGKTFMEISGSEIVHGHQTFKYQIPIIFQ